MFFIQAVAKFEWNKIRENFIKCKKRGGRLSRRGVGNKMLPEFKEILFINSARKPQESCSNFIDINRTSVTETFEETALRITHKI